MLIESFVYERFIIILNKFHSFKVYLRWGERGRGRESLSRLLEVSAQS